METTNQKQSGILKLSILFIIAGTIFDSTNSLVTMPFSNTWVDIHLLLKDMISVGFAIIAYRYIPFTELKLKAFMFMCVFWRVIVTLFNVIGYYDPNITNILYFIFFFWLFRIYAIKPAPLNYNGKLPKNHSYNILIPVHSSNGLLKSLFLPFSDPRYETTILIDGEWMYYVKNKLFFKIKKDNKVIEGLIKERNAKINIKHASPKKIRDINKLNFKRAWLGIRDCRRLQI